MNFTFSILNFVNIFFDPKSDEAERDLQSQIIQSQAAEELLLTFIIR